MFTAQIISCGVCSLSLNERVFLFMALKKIVDENMKYIVRR